MLCVAVSRPWARIRVSARHGSKTGGMPRSMGSTFAASESTPMARIPRAAIAATVGAPTFPIPITLTLVGMAHPKRLSLSGCSRGDEEL